MPSARTPLDHQHREVAAGTALGPQRGERVLHALLLAGEIGEVRPHAAGHVGEQLLGRNAAFDGDEGARPGIDLMARIRPLPLDRAGEVGHVLRPVAEWVMRGVRGEGEDRGVLGGMIEGDAAFEGQGLGAAGERRHRDAVAEHVEQPAQARGLRGDAEGRLDQALVVAVARAEHDPMLAERDRAAIAIDRAVTDGQDRQTGLRARAGFEDRECKWRARVLRYSPTIHGVVAPISGSGDRRRALDGGPFRFDQDVESAPRLGDEHRLARQFRAGGRRGRR